jgi:hypothetical protein
MKEGQGIRSTNIAAEAIRPASIAMQEMQAREHGRTGILLSRGVADVVVILSSLPLQIT